MDLIIAFGAGVLSITAPCTLPLLPGYLGYLTGVSPVGAASNGDRRRTVIAAVLFVVGFSIVFIALGASASELGSVLLANRLPLARIAGVVILAMGLAIFLEGRIGWLSRGGNFSQWAAGGRLWAAPPLGAAFAVTWTPCIGPVLAAVLTMAGSTAQLSRGVALLAAYSLGLGLPFVALSLSVSHVRAWLRKLGAASALLQPASGLLLAVIGVLLITDRWLPLISPFLAWYAQAKWPPI